MTEIIQTTFYKDLLKAQSEIEKVDKDGTNPFFKSDYTTLNSTIAACKKALNDNNIMVLQPIESDQNGVYVCTTLCHISGEKLTSKMMIREAKTNDPQAQGSAITYARRYSLKSMLCMSDSDDDGEKAQQTYREPSKNSPASEKQRKFITNLMRSRGIGISEMTKKYNLKNGDKMNAQQASDAIKWMQSLEDIEEQVIKSIKD